MNLYALLTIAFMLFIIISGHDFSKMKELEDRELNGLVISEEGSVEAVSYTHLDVYKRQGNIGQLNAQELTDVIRQVNEYGGNCILTAVAKRDIYTEGPLVIDVHVEKVEE